MLRHCLHVQDFFRDATQEDLHLILHLIQPPDTDPAFRVGPPGSKTDLPLPLKPAGQSAPLTSPSPGPSTTAAGSAPQHSAASGPASEWATPGQETPGSPFERRSKRLGSKLRLPGEISKYVEDDSDAMDDLTDEPDVKTDPALVAAAAASAAASAAAMTVPLVANGALATCLWDVIPDSKLASLTLEMAQLMAATGVQGPARLDAASVDAAKAAAAAPGGNGAVPLSPELRVRLRKWLEEQAAAISEQLGCKTEVPMLALRRVSAGNGNAGAISAGDGAQEGGSGGSAEVEQAPGIVVALPSAGYFHPYTDLMLGSKVPEHVRRAGTDPLPPDPTLATRTPAVNALGPAQTGDLAGLATPTASLAGGAADASNAGVTDGPAASDLSGLEDGNDSGADHSMGVVQSAGGRSAGRQRSGMNYALMAGRKDPIKAAAAAEARKQVRAATAAMEAEAAAQHPVAVAVAAAVAAGASEGPANEQWAVATRDMRLLAVAPQDEIAAETLALQAELAAVAAANRNRVIPALRALLEDIPRQKEAAEVREQERVEVESWIKVRLIDMLCRAASFSSCFVYCSLCMLLPG